MQANLSKPTSANTTTGNTLARNTRSAPAAVDLTTFPDLVVVYLGFRVSTLRGVLAMLGIGKGLAAIARDKPDGLLAHETILFGPRHVGMRQYWRDMESLETFTRSDPHKTWWARFSKDTKGSGFWHEAYRKSGGMEGLYIGMPDKIGFAAFAPSRASDGAYKRSRDRLAA